MDITIHASFLPHNDPDASQVFYRDTLGFEVRNDVVQEPTEQPYRVRDCAVHDPAGDLLRIQELR